MWVHSLVLIDELGFGRVQISIFTDLGKTLHPVSDQTCSNLGFLEGFQRVQISVLVDKPVGFK